MFGVCFGIGLLIVLIGLVPGLGLAEAFQANCAVLLV